MYPKVVVAILVVAACQANAAAAGARPDHVVFPTGAWPADVQNVQAAIDGGGTLLLKAESASGVPTAFQFGTTGRALLSADVTILGETVAGRMTTILGGFHPFTAVPFRPVRGAIRGIHFAAPRSAAVFLQFSSGFEFTGNVVTDVIGAPSFGGTKGQAVWITEVPGWVTGTITISRNVVERVYADLSYGVALAGFSATTRIAYNTFRGTTDTGVLVVGGTKPVWIEDNLIVPGDAPFPGFFSLGNGMFLGQGSAAFYIRGNTVVCGNPLADGIALSGYLAQPDRVPGNSVIQNNDVTMRNSMFGGLTIYGQIDPSLFLNNRVRGDGAHAILLTPYFGDEQLSSMLFLGNESARFRSTVADVLFDVHTRENLFIGNPGTVIDLGVNNRFIGFATFRTPLDQPPRIAQGGKREWLARLAAAIVR